MKKLANRLKRLLGTSNLFNQELFFGIQTRPTRYILSVLFVFLFVLYVPLPKIDFATNNVPVIETTNNADENLEEPYIKKKDEIKEATQILFDELKKDHSVFLYQTQDNDNSISVSKKFNITERTVIENNPSVFNFLSNKGMIKKGTLLIIPASNGVFKKWMPGDTWKSISLSNHIPVTMLIGWNVSHAGKSSTEMVGHYIFIPFSDNKYREPNPTYPYTNCVPTNRIVGDMNFIWPTITRNISGDIFDLTTETFHAGIDIGVIMRTAVYAVDDGNVVFSGENDLYGNYIVIDHNNGWASLYGHLDEIVVTCGQIVHKGEQIAFSGNTGKSSGPHLHFGLKYENQWQNPMDLLP